MRRPSRIRIITFALFFGLILALALNAPPLQARTGTTVPILIQGHVTLQRPNAAAPDPSWIVPVVLTLSTPGTADERYRWQVTTDDSGNFSLLETFATGTYDVRAKNPHTLRNLRRNVTFTGGINVLDMGTLLEGDANDDNRVNVADFVILRNAYFTEEGRPGFDPRADFDEDNRINVRDFALLRANYFTEGDVVLSQRARRANATAGVLYILPAVARTMVGRLMTMTVYMDTGLQATIGADVILTFDPTALQVVDATGVITSRVTPGDAFDTVLSNNVDNTAGRIAFGAGTFGAPVTGRHTLFTFHILPLHDTFSTPVNFAYVDVVNPDGRSLETRTYSARVRAGDYVYQFVPITARSRPAVVTVHVPLLLVGAH